VITVKLDTPLLRVPGDKTTPQGYYGIPERVSVLYLETPIMARHIIRAVRDTAGQGSMAAGQRFVENAFGLEPGELERLTLEDYAKVMEAIQPFMASFERLQKG
jgi:hypothetical protein